jgi:hypothetical protein
MPTVTGTERAESKEELNHTLLYEIGAPCGAPWSIMPELRQSIDEQEPVGIVISSGTRVEHNPRFTAYVWGPVPETESPSSKEMVAA